MFNKKITYLLLVLTAFGVCTAAYVQGALKERDVQDANADGTRVFSSFSKPRSVHQSKHETKPEKTIEVAGFLPQKQESSTVVSLNRPELNDSKHVVKKIDLKKIELPAWMKDLFLQEDLEEKTVQEAVLARSRQGGLAGSSGISRSKAKESETPAPGSFEYRVHAFYPGKMGDGSAIRDSGLITQDILQKVVGAPDFSIWSSDEQKDKILSLGLGGIIILEIQDGYVLDEDGPDFVVFENPFVISGTQGQVFAETALVSVAIEDKEDAYRTFPCQSKEPPYQGCAGVAPVLYNANIPLDQVGGDLFDLKDVGLDRIKYIRIQDTGDHPAMFPGKEGFDLDAIGLIHTRGLAHR